ncbi:2,3-diaminopropionate biosynthesis protein SbnA [Dickeya zeae]|uniref:2,3-diaminopropionate biosynthesis protein SbnA n=1 Tax=Dickeya zeae TaxID=204042 RepID=UPI00143FBA94|nr:2,3-diaminopropionate biosynthesis protein SbnA [Dickeya zeae]QIZ47731.1 2,3-diaminopropionate biosynthesis protein SbnA [Dickeya zeae]UUE08636.1 2,3-diaminopropionate biosynthesis protein SbnA [Dickeya zeae]
MLFNDISPLIQDDCFLTLKEWINGRDIILKIEGLSVSGSIKIKSALYMLEELERRGVLKKGNKIIESSSGNLGIALSMICAWKGYTFICVGDPNMSPAAAKIIAAYGGELITVTETDNQGGYLGTRISHIKEKINKDKNIIWVNQYENIDNINAHYYMTGKSILQNVPHPDYVFIGAGTTGTLGGVSRYLKEHSPSTRIIAVDTYGSVTFGGCSAKRRIPGLGTSCPPDIRKYSHFDELLYIDEASTIKTCHELSSRGLLLGGSTGTVLAAVRLMQNKIKPEETVVVISPDMGDKYLNTIYNPDWVNQYYQ